MRRFHHFVLGLLGLLLLSSCGEDSGFTEPVDIPVGNVIVTNLISDSPELTVFSPSQLVGQLHYTISSGIQVVTPQVPVEFRVLHYANDNQVTLMSPSITVDIDHVQNVILSGTMAAPTTIFADNAPPDFADGSTDALFQFVNATTSVDSMSVTLTNPQADTQSAVVANGEVSSLLTTTGGEGLQIEVRDSATDDLLWSSGDFTFSALTVREFILIDYFGPGDEAVKMFTVNDLTFFSNEQLDIAVRLANTIPDRGPIDISVDDTVVASNLAFGEFTDYVTIPAGTNDFSVSTFGDSEDIIFTSTRIMIAGYFHTFAATGSGDTNSGSISVDNKRPIPSHAQFQLTNLAVSTTSVDVFLLKSGEAITETMPVSVGLTPSSFFAIEFDPGSFDLVVTTNNTEDVLFGPQRLDFEANQIYELILTDAEGGGAPMQAIYLDGF